MRVFFFSKYSYLRNIDQILKINILNANYVIPIYNAIILHWSWSLLCAVFGIKNIINHDRLSFRSLNTVRKEILILELQ